LAATPALTGAAGDPPATSSPIPAQWTPPILPDGHPDLQGVWLNNSATPLERPKALAGRPSLTNDEVAELRKRAARLLADPANDFPAGDAVFLAALENAAQYKNPNVTGSATDTIERVFDNRTSLIVDPPDGAIPWTPEGKQRFDTQQPNRRRPVAADPEDLSNEARCLTYGVPRLGLNNTNSAGPLGYQQIVQTPGYVVLLYEGIHEARIIPLDRRPHLSTGMWLWSGDSRGWWEGHTLVVDTTNFSPRATVMGSTEHLHLVERFTADRLTYTMTLEDPATWTRPLTVEIRLQQRSELIFEYACHEGSFEIIQDLLRAPRADEKADAALPKRPR
jgi:hypothetical protein